MAFSYTRSATVDHTKCGSADSAAFPVLVSITLTSAHVQNANGYDVYFYSDSGLTTRIPAERESYNSGTGAWLGWVKVDITFASDAVFYIAYGDAGVSSDPNSDVTYGTTNTWNSNFKGVYHLPNGTTLTASDSTSNANNGTLVNTPTATTGQIDGGGSFNGDLSQSITVGTGASLNMAGTQAFTVSAWIKATGNFFSQICSKYDATAPQYKFYLESGGLLSLYREGSPFSVMSGSSNLVTSTWTHVSGSYDGTNMRVYVAGSQQGTATASGSISGGNGIATRIGGREGTNFFYGQIDEVHISTTARTVSWLLSEYNNQNSPSTFLTFGSETAVGGGGGSSFPPVPSLNQQIRCIIAQ